MLNSKNALYNRVHLTGVIPRNIFQYACPGRHVVCSTKLVLRVFMLTRVVKDKMILYIRSCSPWLAVQIWWWRAILKPRMHYKSWLSTCPFLYIANGKRFDCTLVHFDTCQSTPIWLSTCPLWHVPFTIKWDFKRVRLDGSQKVQHWVLHGVIFTRLVQYKIWLYTFPFWNVPYARHLDRAPVQSDARHTVQKIILHV